MKTTIGTMSFEAVVARVRNGEGFALHAGSDDFNRGVKLAGKMEYVTIAINNTWGGRAKDGGHVTSYEKIGYHAGSVGFLAGVLSTDCPVYAYDGGWYRVTN